MFLSGIYTQNFSGSQLGQRRGEWAQTTACCCYKNLHGRSVAWCREISDTQVNIVIYNSKFSSVQEAALLLFLSQQQWSKEGLWQMSPLEHLWYSRLAKRKLLLSEEMMGGLESLIVVSGWPHSCQVVSLFINLTWRCSFKQCTPVLMSHADGAEHLEGRLQQLGSHCVSSYLLLQAAYTAATAFAMSWKQK